MKRRKMGVLIILTMLAILLLTVNGTFANVEMNIPVAKESMKNVSGQLDNLVNGPKDLKSMVSAVTPDNGATVVRPESAVTITLNMTDDRILKEFSIKDDKTSNHYGVAFISDKGNFLATQENGYASYTISGNSLVITAKHPILNRYTTYNMYLLVGEALNKYNSEEHSNGHSNSFGKGEAFSRDSYEWSFTTGSEIGEPTHWTVNGNPQPSVIDGDTITVSATDDYGDVVTSGSVNYEKTITTDGTELSNTFAIMPTSAELSGGSTSFSVIDHKAQSITVSFAASGPYPEQDNKELTFSMAFQPGPPSIATMIIDKNTLIAGETAKISGNVQDMYGNPVNPSALDITVSAGSVDSPVTTGENGSYSFIYNAPQKLTSTLGTGEQVDINLKSEQGSATSSLNGITVNPGPTATITLNASKTTLNAGNSITVSGSVSDQYGNAVLDGTTIDLTASAGNIPATATTKGGCFSVSYSSPSSAGNVTIGANVGSVTATPLSLTIIAADPAVMDLNCTLPANAVDGAVPADGTSAATITAIIKDVNGNPAIGTVEFTNTLGQLSSQSVSLNNGSAVVTLTSVQEGSSTVTAEIGDLVKTITVTFGSPQKPVEIGQAKNLSGNAEYIGFTINTDGKFWIAKGRNNAIFTTLINSDGTIYKPDIKNPAQFFWTGSRGYYYDSDILPAIQANGKGQVMLVWSRFKDGQFYLMGNQYSAGGGAGPNTYLLGGDNRYATFGMLGNMMKLVWSRNVNQQYYTFQLNEASIGVDYDGRASYGDVSTLISTGKNYTPAIAFANDSAKTQWTFYTKSVYPNDPLMYSVNTSNGSVPIFTKQDVILENNDGAAEPTAIAYNNEILVAYQKGSDIVIRRISAQGVVGSSTVLIQGSCPRLAKDNSGNIWLAWIGIDKTVNYAPLTIK